jgi:hypothetical protein
LERQPGFRCNLEIDHIRKIGEGGNHSTENLRVLCFVCHALRHGRKAPETPRRQTRGSRFGKPIPVRLTPKQEQLVERLAERLQVAPVEVLRRGLMKLAREEGINGDETKAN